MEKTVSQSLQEGRARIVAGWGQRRAVSEDGLRFCAVGALGELFRFNELALKALFEALPPGGLWVSVQHYNDDPERTQADILALYDRALTAVTK